MVLFCANWGWGWGLAKVIEIVIKSAAEGR